MIAGMDARRAMKHPFAPLSAIGIPGPGPERFGQPAAVAFDGDGRLVVGDGEHGGLHLFAPGGRWLHSWREPDFLPAAVAVGPDGAIWACDRFGGRVLRFSPAGDRAGAVGGGSAFAAPAGIAALPDGRIAVADTGNHRIRVFAADGAPEADYDGGSAGRMAEPHGLAVDQHGTLVAVDRGRRRLVRFGPEWDHPEPIDLQLAPGSPIRPWGVAVDRAGRLAVSLSDSHRVLLLSPGGDLLSVLHGEGSQVGPLRWPTALAFGPGDLLAVADTYNGRVVLAKAR